MNKQELVAKVTESTKVSKKEAEAVIKATLETIMEAVAAGEKVQMIGFGTFEPRERAARNGHNPLTGKTIKIAATTVPAFKAGKLFKDAVAPKKPAKAAKKAKKK